MLRSLLFFVLAFWKEVKNKVSQLLFNITLIISFMFAASIVREQIIYRVEGIKRYKMYRLIYYGCSYGLLGSILMIYDSTIILDLRFLAVTIVCLYAGMVPAIIAACIIGVMRLLLFGITASGIVGASAIIVMALLSGWTVRLPYRTFICFQLMNSISLLCVFFSLSFLFSYLILIILKCITIPMAIFKETNA